MKKRIGAALMSGLMCLSMCTGALSQNDRALSTVSAASGPYMEDLDRGITAVNTGSGMLVSWRFLADDPDNAVFKLYRDDTLVYTSNSGDATCYLDAGGSSSSTYRVETYNGDSRIGNDTCKFTSGGNYFDVKLDRPGSIYTPNDCSVGDVDGDGQYELFVKWDPNNSQDNSKGGKTDKVYIDCYRLDGTKLWRIDLGYNIRAGAHYTQFLVADFDLDGKAEMTCKTADGTVDGQGNVIGDASASYRNSKGYILSGPEYYTLFDGETGKALDTVDYNPPRGTVSSWGDSYGNRCDRFLGAVMYLDGEKPSAVTVRGYYTRLTACAYDVVDDKLVQRWYFDTGNSSSANGYGDGNHNCMPADVDGDGKQELVFGSLCLDDNGTVKWNVNKGHGDAMHLGDFLPDNSGLELWICHEVKPYGGTLVDCDNGSTIFHYDADGDTGRCAAGNIWTGNAGGEFWFGNTTYNGAGQTLSCRRPALNFLSYWDGDLEREVLDGYTDSPATITDMGADGILTTILSTDGYYTCNTTKGTPCLSADLFGDWREELICRAADGNSVRIFATTYDTDYRITTLMHDTQYRTQVAGQNIAYNQPPHPSFYLGSEEELPARPNVNICVGAVIDTTHTYKIKNQNSGLYLEVAAAVAANGTNVQQGTTGALNWTFEDAGDGYYRVYSELGDGKTYLLDLDYGNPDNGTNIGIWGDTQSDAQLFKFVQNGDGSYTICTKATADGSALGVTAASKDEGANVIQWVCDGTSNQNWILEIVIPVLNGKLITNLQVLDVSTYKEWSIDSSVAVGDLMFGDRTATYLELPADLIGGEAILTACDSKFTDADLATFTAGADMTAYVALDSRVTTAPSWLGDWTLTDMTTCYNTDFNFKIYAKELNAGDTITLGKNGQSSGCVNYTVIAVAREAVSTTTTTEATTTTTEVTTTTEATTTTAVADTTAVTNDSQDSGAVTTDPSVQTETTTTTATTDSGATEDVLYGDVNLDGEVSIIDVVMLNKFVMGAEELNSQQKLNGNVNLDDKCDASDSLVILKFLVDLVTELPVQ